MTFYTFSQLILNWYHVHGRKNLPWQINKTLYTVWISEIMLQQTQVKTVIPYFKKFISIFPNLNTLKTAKLDEIMYLWSGLGYYKRAKNIYETMIIIKKKFNGQFPKNFLDLIQLPGIGKSTAGAILSFTLNYCFSILDGNIKRVLIRYYGIIGCSNNTKSEKILWNIIENITPIHNTGKFNQGIMDIGALICTIKLPNCSICPLNVTCVTYKEKQWNKYYLQKNKKIKLNEKYWFIVVQYKNNVWMEKNISNNIWNNLFIFPIFFNKKYALEWLKEKKINIKQHKIFNSFIHEFSHFKIYAIPILIKLDIKIKNFSNITKGIWYNFEKPPKIGIPTLVKKILKLII